MEKVCKSIFVFMLAATSASAVCGQARSRDADDSWRRPLEFNVDVLVDERPQPEYRARGRRYVEAVEGAEYAIRITNPLPVRVAVALAVDGLNTIDARRTTSWEASKWVIMPHQTITINGWQMSSARARRFYFTDERDSYGAKLGRTAHLGIISAVFFRERETIRPIAPPLDSRHRPQSEEKSARRDRSAPSSSRPESTRSSIAGGDDYAATGIGRSVSHDVQWVNLDLQRQPASEISLRYEYRPQLIRLGVIPRHRAIDPLQNRERATGFENRSFSPEP